MSSKIDIFFKNFWLTKEYDMFIGWLFYMPKNIVWFYTTFTAGYIDLDNYCIYGSSI